MAGEWRDSTWGDEISLEYGKALRGYNTESGKFRVFGSNGPIGWHSEYLTTGPGIILGRKGAYRGVQYCREPFWVIDTAYYVVPKTELDLRWLFYAIKHYKLGEIDDGSPIPSTTRAAVYIKELSIPSLKEQQAIACILGALDDKIELNRRRNETLEEMGLAIFQSWFVDFDPVRAKAAGLTPPGLKPELASIFPNSFDVSPLGEIPSGWYARRLYDTAKYVNGAAFKNKDFCEKGIGLPVVKIAELKEGLSSQTMYSLRELESDRTIDTGDLLYSWSGSPDTSLDAFLWSKGRGLLNQHIFKVVTTDITQKRFVYYLLKYLRPVLVEMARNKQTTGLGHVTVADMKRLNVCWPAAAVFSAFDQRVGPIFDKAFSGSLENQTLADLRDILLPKLISGEMRIPDAERIVARAV